VPYDASIAPNEDDLSVAHFNSTSGAYGRVAVLGRGSIPASRAIFDRSRFPKTGKSEGPFPHAGRLYRLGGHL
jgi:hypothetical protein